MLADDTMQPCRGCPPPCLQLRLQLGQAGPVTGGGGRSAQGGTLGGTAGAGSLGQQLGRLGGGAEMRG